MKGGRRLWPPRPKSLKERGLLCWDGWSRSRRRRRDGLGRERKRGCVITEVKGDVNKKRILLFSKKNMWVTVMMLMLMLQAG